MIEFHIPEPAVSLLERDKSRAVSIPKPAPFNINPVQIKQSNYLCLTQLYGALDIEPPPALYTQVGFNWNSTPDESVDQHAEDVFSETIIIPNNYVPVVGRAKVKALSVADDGTQKLIYSLMLAGKAIIQKTTDSPQSKSVLIAGEENPFSFIENDNWPEGVPETFIVHNHRDKTAVVHVTIQCERTYEAYTDWQLRTWEKLREAHQVLVSEYQQAKAEADFAESELIQIEGRPEAVNRRIERDELKKWSVKLLRRDFIDFNAIENATDGFQEVSPKWADYQAPIVRFFEESFEWRHMSYFLYPYYWGRRQSWKMRQNITYPDSKHEAFLRAGAARLVVPVTPGYETRVASYLESDPELKDLERIYGQDTDQISVDSDAEDLWLEILINRNEELALGSGTLSVEKNNIKVLINDDSKWEATERDLGREIYIDGEQYQIESIVSVNEFNLNSPYKGITDEHARYATGSVPFGQPWLVNLPTTLIVLSEEKNKLEQLN